MKMTKNNTIKCPNCGEEINIESLIQAGAKDELDKQLALQQTEFNKKYNELKAQNSALSEKYEQEKAQEIEKVLNEFKKKQTKAVEELRKKIEE